MINRYALIALIVGVVAAFIGWGPVPLGLAGAAQIITYLAIAAFIVFTIFGITRRHGGSGPK
jgi:uncharacterized membrane protein YtjA (UPF0391 family)